MKRRLLLHAGGDITTAMEEIGAHLQQAKHAVFLPYALHDHDAYTGVVSERMRPLGVSIKGLHQATDPAEAIENADAIIVGGGNSFRLVAALHKHGLIEPVRARIALGVPYFGASAGTNVACPTIRTTNDMPIVQPPSFAAFALVPFQINPHYVDPPPPDARVGETRAQRIREFLEANDIPVVGLREQSWLRVDDEMMELRGTSDAVLFRRDRDPEEVTSGADLSWLLGAAGRFDVVAS